jgi:hypothetical protein
MSFVHPFDDFPSVEEVNRPKTDPCLYVFVNTNLESMNAGKAMAQSSHCSNAFIWHAWIQATEVRRSPLVRDWMRSTGQGFGTQSNLKADDFMAVHDELKQYAKDHPTVIWGNCVDPTYPFEVSKEVYHLLRAEYKTDAVERSDKYLCVRQETTAFYIFGDRNDPEFKSYIRKWKRHP